VSTDDDAMVNLKRVFKEISIALVKKKNLETSGDIHISFI
jgi:hypothetical protein